MDPKQKFNALSASQAILGGLICAGITGLYLLNPAALGNPRLTIIIATLGLIAALYYLSVHQFIKRTQLTLSSLIITIISTSNLFILICATGGLSSPFFAFWLLVIVAAGLFGPTATIVTVAATVIWHILVMASHNSSLSYYTSHLGQILAVIAAGALAQWLYRQQHAPFTAAANSSNQEQLKAEVLMSSMTDGVIVVDANSQIQLINKAAQDMTGWDDASARGLDYRLVFHLKTSAGEDLDTASDPFQVAWTKRTGLVRNDLSILTKTDRTLALSVSVSPVYNPDQSISGGIMVFRDISQEKEVERQRSEFVSTASHEMRTPVAAIEGYISLAMNPKVAAIDDRAQSYLTKAHDNTQHLGELFRDLLSVTKVEEGQITKHLVTVNLSQLIQNLINDLQFNASKKGLSLNFNVAANAVAGRNITPIYYIKGDPERLKEVTVNLIDNALKFTPQGGITVSIAGDAQTVTVRVQDTGPGIAPENIPHLFQKFYRVDNSATRTIGGTGLGLYLCRAVIERHNGRIWVESTPGQGTTFSFSLPRLPASQVEAETLNAPSAPAPVAAPATAPVVASAVPASTPIPAQAPSAALSTPEPAPAT